MYKVIVAITTYNLEKYIAQALDSVINQKTNFSFLIRVADDCSTDNTPKILKAYSEKYPDLIEVLYSAKNMGSLANSNRLFDYIDCEYFSFLDGDDYWIDEKRLQKQVDFLDSHTKFSMVAGNTQYMRNNVLSDFVVDRKYLNKTFSYDDFVNSRMPFFHTSSVLVRNTIFINGLPDIYNSVVGTFEECALRGEDARRYIHIKNGPVYIMSDLFSVYRIHDLGIWQGKSKVRQTLEAAIQYNFFLKCSNDQPSKQYFKKQFNLEYTTILNHLFHLNDNVTVYKYTEKDAALLAALVLDISKRNTSQKLSHKESKRINAYLELLFSKLYR